MRRPLPCIIFIALCIGSAAAAQIISIDDIQQYDPATGVPLSPFLGTIVQIQGSITAERGTYDAVTSYIQDTSGGIQLWGAELDAKQGDILLIEGTVGKSPLNELIVVLHQSKYLQHQPPLEPVRISIGDIVSNYENVGSLVACVGRIAGKGEDEFHVTGGLDTVTVLVDPDTGIDLSSLSIGGLYTVAGVCANNSGTIALMPRFSADIKRVPILPLGQELVVNPDGTGDAPTIQAAVDMAANYTTILLSDGTFTGPGNRDIDYKGKILTIRSASDDPESCIIDCQYKGRGVILDSEEEQGTVLRGVSIVDGYGSDGGGGIKLGTSAPEIINCRIMSCTVKNGQFGGGVYCGDWSSATFTDCVIAYNSAGSFHGGGVYCADGASAAFYGCTIYNNTASFGNGVAVDTGFLTMQNCTLYGNGFDVTNWPELTLMNTIIAFNSGLSFTFNNYEGSVNLSCCDIHGNTLDWTPEIADQLGLSGNISADPLFLAAETGDFRLSVSSPCAPANSGGCKQIGAWPTGSYVVDPDPGGGDYIAIQTAVDDVPDGATVELADAVFSGPGNVNIDPQGKSVVIKSQSGNPGACVIDCSGSEGSPVRAFWFHSGEDTSTVVQGITIINGYAVATRDSVGGGGILCDDGSSPKLKDIVLRNNRAETGGGGLHISNGSEPVIEGCTFEGNESQAPPDKAATTGGGGLHIAPESGATVSGSTFDGNRSGSRGKRGYAKAANTGGGGMHIAQTATLTMFGCTIVGSDSPDGGAVYCEENANTSIYNSIIAFSAGGTAAVVCEENVTLRVICCDIYGNPGGDWTGCLEGLAGADGNISLHPRFCDLAGGDYSLADNSPCAAANNPGCGLIGAWPEGGCSLTFVLKADGTGDYANLQEALAAVPDGAVIVLEDGTYSGAGNRNLTLGSKSALTIRSQSEQPENCIIDCGNSRCEARRAIAFGADQGPGTVLQGLTIRNGYAGLMTGGRGGAILCEAGAAPTIHNCVFAFNRACMRGGALFCADSSPTFSECVFESNRTGPVGVGGAAFYVRSTPSFEFCTFLDNSSLFGGAVCSHASQAQYVNCSFVGGGALCGGGIYALAPDTLDVQKSIVAFNARGRGIACCGPVIATLSCCDIFGNGGGDWTACIADQYGSSGNFSADPLFCDLAPGDLRLASGSPCSPDNSGSCGLIGACSEPCRAAAAEKSQAAPAVFRLHACYPNPFNPTTTIRFDLPRDQKVRLSVYDLAGRRIATLVEGNLRGGSHEVVWRGQDDGGRQVASGVYFYRIEAGKNLQSRRMLLLK